MLKLQTLTPTISYFPAINEPLSSEVIIIDGGAETYIFDAGRGDISADYLKQLNKTCMIISHFHTDHTYNLRDYTPDRMYVSKNTYKYTKSGTIVSEDILLDDGRIRVFTIPSSHAKGCLGIEVNKEYAFLGDALYGASNKPMGEAYNYQLLQQTIKVVESLSAEKLVIGHRLPNTYTQKEMLRFLSKQLVK